MKGRRKYLFKNVTLSSLRDWLNKTVKRESGGEFTMSHVQGYVKRRKIPEKFGGALIEKVPFEDPRIKLYNVFIIESEDENKREVCDNE